MAVVHHEAMETGWTRVGAAVKAARAGQNLTQDGLAARVGVGTSTIRAIERGTEFAKVTPTLRAIERVLGWGHGSIESIRDGGDSLPAGPSSTDAPSSTPIGINTEGLPARVIEAMKGERLDFRVMPLGPNAELVVFVQGRPEATAEEARAELRQWERRERMLERMQEVADDPPDNG